MKKIIFLIAICLLGCEDKKDLTSLIALAAPAPAETRSVETATTSEQPTQQVQPSVQEEPTPEPEPIAEEEPTPEPEPAPLSPYFLGYIYLVNQYEVIVYQDQIVSPDTIYSYQTQRDQMNQFGDPQCPCTVIQGIRSE